ncbi:MAG: DUF190 domain-containing protein [Gammaproteobacteria bacterium]
MNTTTNHSSEVTIVRIYLTEGEAQLHSLIKRLRDWEKLRGVTVFRGIAGFGPSGIMHGIELVDLSLNMPIVIEFFDSTDKVNEILEHLEHIVPAGHLVKWKAEVNA